MADLALSWKDHHNVLISVFEKLLENKALVDCTLAAEGKFLKAHKIVLSACSPYLEALLNQENDKHPIIFLRDVQFEDLKTLVEFVYSGEIKIAENRLVEFLSVAEALQIKGLGGAENEVSSKRPVSESARKKESTSPVLRKRSRRQSNEPDGKSQGKNDLESRRENSEPQQDQVSHLKIASVGSLRSSHRKLNTTENLPPAIIKIKEEVANTHSGVHIASEQPQPEHVPNDTTEEILGLKPEFEQVTFTEDYSEDLLPEDEDSVEQIHDPDQPSSSQEYSEFSPNPVASGGLAIQSPFTVTGGEQRTSEGGCNEYQRQRSNYNGIHPTQMGVSNSAVEALAGNATMPTERTSDQDTRQRQMYQRSHTSRRDDSRSSLGRKHSIREGSVYPSGRNSDVGELIGRWVAPNTVEGQKKHRCDTCFKEFRHSWFLRRHIVVHTGEKPYGCHVCGKRFTESGSLKRHVLQAHKGARYNK